MKTSASLKKARLVLSLLLCCLLVAGNGGNFLDLGIQGLQGVLEGCHLPADKPGGLGVVGEDA